MSDDTYIACPRCYWEPDGHPYWSCSCGHIWDTFATGGQCPACHKKWTSTQCIDHAGGCGQFSPHKQWYHSLDTWLQERLKEVNAEVLIKELGFYDDVYISPSLMT